MSDGLGILIGFLIGFTTATVLLAKTDAWRIKLFLDLGYDRAVRHILKFGHYFDKDGKCIAVQVEKIKRNDGAVPPNVGSAQSDD